MLISLVSKHYKVLKLICDNSEITLRKIALESKYQEKVVENILLKLMNENYLENNPEILNTNSIFKPTQTGLDFYNKYKDLTIEYINATHTWHQMGAHGDFAGNITKDKWFPMGSICKKCGLKTKEFKINPIICPAYKI